MGTAPAIAGGFEILKVIGSSSMFRIAMNVVSFSADAWQRKQ
jgi:hypothetical protein